MQSPSASGPSGRTIAMIERYRTATARRAIHSGCRFEPSCSTFALEALRRRPLLVAFLQIAWRLMRCNPLIRAVSKDPVARVKGEARPNGLRTGLVLAGICLWIVGSLQGMASGQVGGGCSALLNGLPLAALHRDNPLVVRAGQTVVVQGTVPPSLVTSDPNEVKSSTQVAVFFADPWKLSAGRKAEGSGTTWIREVDPAAYLRLGSGLYRVEATSYINAPAGTRVCVGTAYVKLEGGKAIQAAAAALGAGGLAAGTAARGRGRKSVTMSELGKDIDNDIRRDVEGLDPPESGPYETSVNREYSSGLAGLMEWGCGWPFILLVPVLMIAGLPPGDTAGSPERRTFFSRVYRRRGHTILGFIGGLFFGIGLTVAIQQQGIWALTMLNAIVLPVVLGLVFGSRARRGVPYRVTARFTD